MTDLDIVEQAVNAVLEKARRENPTFMSMPITGYTIMQWFQEALKEVRYNQLKTQLDKRGPTA